MGLWFILRSELEVVLSESEQRTEIRCSKTIQRSRKERQWQGLPDYDLSIDDLGGDSLAKAE